MQTLQFYNTRTRTKETFTPICKDYVRLYVCGPTVYDDIHIGNARPLIIFDLLFRFLRQLYGKEHVIYVRNITDVDDKINKRAQELYPDCEIDQGIDQLTASTIKRFHEACALMGCERPSEEPRARSYIEKMKAIIEQLLAKGYAYQEEDHVLFSVDQVKPPLHYGAFSHRKLEDMRAGTRVSVASYKRNEMDFVLWKPSKAGEPSWASPAGIAVRGRPGWHIECSAMSMAKLLEPFGGGLESSTPETNIFDIHGGGIDLVFPHHENEIAQTCCALGTDRMANLWMHNGHLQVEGQKMSKSLGNFITVHEILQDTALLEEHKMVGAEAAASVLGLGLRLSMLKTHYREPINWTRARLCESVDEIIKWHKLIANDLEGKESSTVHQGASDADLKEILSALADDLNSANVITILRAFYKKKQAASLFNALKFLGLFHKSLCKQKDSAAKEQLSLDAEIQEAIKKREEYIARKAWDKADAIRQSLLEKGFKLQDKKDPHTGERITQVIPI